MQKLTIWTSILIFCLVILPNTSSIQAQGALDYEKVTIRAADDLELFGLYSGTEGLEDESGLVPAVLLMHHGGSVKEKWIEFFPAFYEANYAYLAVDIREHGETGGNGEQAGTAENFISDTQLWVDWLREQDGIDSARISIIGASLGGDIGLNVMHKMMTW